MSTALARMQSPEHAGVAIATRWYVYALCEPTSTGAVRYIGKSRDPWKRLDSHCASSAAVGVRNWVRSLGSDPEIRVLGEYESNAQALIEERRIIREYRLAGAGLLNRVTGGQRGGKRPHHFRGFGARVVEMRIRLSMSQADLLASAGLSVGTLSRIERGHRKTPNAETAVLLARALGVSVEWLVTGEERAQKASAA